MKRSKAAVLGLTALALLAMSALVISGAQGNPTAANHVAKITHHFQCLKLSDDKTLQPECTGHGEEKETHRKHNEVKIKIHEFTVPLGSVKCENVTFTVTKDADGTSATSPTTPEYSECEAIGNPAEVNTNGCHYEFNIEETITTPSPPAGYESTEGKGSSILTCPAGKVITVTFEGVFGAECHIEVKPQKTITPIYFRNKSTATTDLTVEPDTATVIAKGLRRVLQLRRQRRSPHHLHRQHDKVIGQIAKSPSGHEQVNVRFEDGKAHS